MKENKISILSTRPLAHTTMMLAEEKGIQIDVESFIETRVTIDNINGNKILKLAKKEVAIVFTSMNAAEAVIDCLKALNAEPEWTIYTLGGITGTIVKSAFTGSEVFSDAINAKQIAEIIIANEETEIIFFCGNQRRDELPDMLKQQNIAVEEVEVYETIETPVKINMIYSGILFFSPSAVQSFFSVNKVEPATVLFAIGTTTAAALKKFSNNKVFAGNQPHKEQLAELAMNYLMGNAEL